MKPDVGWQLACGSFSDDHGGAVTGLRREDPALARAAEWGWVRDHDNWKAACAQDLLHSPDAAV